MLQELLLTYAALVRKLELLPCQQGMQTPSSSIALTPRTCGSLMLAAITAVISGSLLLTESCCCCCCCHLQELLAPVLSVMLYEITAALPGDLRICLLQLLPSLAIQPGEPSAIAAVSWLPFMVHGTPDCQCVCVVWVVYPQCAATEMPAVSCVGCCGWYQASALLLYSWQLLQ
jgi:hypothetical protein